MSGGSFNYLYLHMEDEPFNHLGQLDDMVKFALANTEMGEELRQLQEYLVKVEKQVQARTKPLLPLMKAIEWWVSGDWSEDSLEQEWQEYLSKKKDFVDLQDKKLSAYAAYINGSITRAELDEVLNEAQ